MKTANPYLVDFNTAETFDVMGAIVQFLIPQEEGGNAPCIMRGTIPPGGVVPLHSHEDPETFFAISGEAEGLVHSAEGFSWVRITPGGIFHVPGNAKHAWRNQSKEPVVNIIVTTAKIVRFFREIGTPVEAGTTTASPPSDAAIEHFLETAERYGYWNATPEENAEIGITLPTADRSNP